MLRVLEVYASFQGEGPNTGKPTVFVRFAGCNLKCPLWPCDTQHAIDPKQYRKEQMFVTADTLYREAAAFDIRNICVTGGEPFLQDGPSLAMFVNLLRMGSHTVEVFTNGTLERSQQAGETFRGFTTFVVDWKLPGSGEHKEPLDVNWKNLNNQSAIKFTIRTVADFKRAVSIWNEKIHPFYTANGIRHASAPVVYCGVVWGGELNTEQLAQLILNAKLPWRLNVQVHKFIWDPNERGV